MKAKKRTKDRIIERLRREFPGKWTYEGGGRWKGPEFEVQCYAQFNSEWWDDYETFARIYLRADTQEHVLFA